MSLAHRRRRHRLATCVLPTGDQSKFRRARSNCRRGRRSAQFNDRPTFTMFATTMVVAVAVAVAAAAVAVAATRSAASELN